MQGMITVLRKTGMFWSSDRGSYNSLYCVAGVGMTAEQSGGYLEIFGRFGEPTCESKPARDAKLAERLEEYTKEEMKKGGWVQ